MGLKLGSMSLSANGNFDLLSNKKNSILPLPVEGVVYVGYSETNNGQYAGRISFEPFDPN